MRLVRVGPRGAEVPGLFAADGSVRSLRPYIEDISPATIPLLESLVNLDPDALEVISAERVGPCVSAPGKFICIGLNYSDHAAETGAAAPVEPIIFLKATSAVSGPYDDILIPPGSEKTDWEVELGVVIGRTARHVPVERAREHIFGYCVVNDVSERAYQLERGGSWDKGKGYDSFGPIGPWLVTRDEIEDPQALSMWLDVDGRRFQNGTTGNMIFGIDELVSYVSQFMTLHPGDLISTGTPAGVGLGQRPPVYLRPGQKITLGIEGLGEQRQRTVRATA